VGVIAVAEQVELELGLDGGGVLRCSVSAPETERLVQAFGRDSAELLRLETDRGRVVVDMRRVTYLRELSRRRPVGFGG
jgi:hypothetical protein